MIPPVSTSEILLFIPWIAFSFGVAHIAGKKNRSRAAFFWLSVFLTPVVGLLVALSISNGSPKLNKRSGCPYCKEEILMDATICRHCKKELEPELRNHELIPQPWISKLSLWQKIAIGLLALVVSGLLVYSLGAKPPSEAMEACSRITIILGPINSGPPSVKEFEDTFTVLDALAGELEDQQIRAAIGNYTRAGSVLTSEVTELGGWTPDSMQAFQRTSDALVDACEDAF